MTRHQLKTLAKQQIKGKIGILFVIALIIGLIGAAVAIVPIIGAVASLIITPALSLSTVIIYLNITKNPEKKPEVKDALVGFENTLGAVKVYFAQTIFTFLWTLLFYIPGIIKAFAYSQALYILAENPDIGGREAIKRSEEMMRGHKMDYFILMLSFYGWIILSAFTLGILLIWLIPYMNATLTNFYNSIKSKATFENIENVQFN